MEKAEIGRQTLTFKHASASSYKRAHSPHTCRPERRSPAEKSGHFPGVWATAALYSSAVMARLTYDTCPVHASGSLTATS